METCSQIDLVVRIEPSLQIVAVAIAVALAVAMFVGMIMALPVAVAVIVSSAGMGLLRHGL